MVYHFSRGCGCDVVPVTLKMSKDTPGGTFQFERGCSLRLLFSFFFSPLSLSFSTHPDVRGCCMKNGVTHRTCLDKMCDPVKADFTEVPDLMVCAPWANITFACLANKMDHTPCCKARGIPDGCLSFCSGTVKAINFNQFKCLQYMSDYSSCLLQGYGVLSGPPSKLKAVLVDPHYVVLEWNPPKILPDTVVSYHLHYRRLGSGEEYSVIEREQSPVIVEDLEAGQYYEAFVVAVNAHGKGGPSPRLVFQTKREVGSKKVQLK